MQRSMQPGERLAPSSRPPQRAVLAAIIVLGTGGLAILSGLAACGRPQPGTVGPTATTQPAPTPTLVVLTQVISFAAADGVPLRGALYGQGTRAIILSNEGDNVSGTWLPVAQRLASQGYLVLTYAYRAPASPDHQPSQSLLDLQGAIAFLRARHVSALALMGSSLGGLIALKAAILAPVDAVVAISSPVEFEDVHLSDSELGGLRVPKLFVTSDENEPFTSDTQHMFDVTPAPKDQRVYPGRIHGVRLFEGASGTDLWLALLDFLRRHVPTISEEAIPTN